MNKKSILISLVAFLFSVMFVSLTFASTYTVTLLGSQPYMFGNGGEFTFQSSDLMPLVGSQYVETGSIETKNVLSTMNTFQTFCVEWNEHINFGGTYTAAISDGAINGGASGGNPDKLSIGAAYLYYNFVKGTLGKDTAVLSDDYIYTGASRNNSAKALQEAIWALEGEGGSTSSIYYQLVLWKFGTDAAAKADNYNGTTRSYNVRVLNLTASDGVHQDQLVATPIPGAIWLLGSGLAGLVGWRKTRRKAILGV
jgi:hypothetical protein